MTIAELIAHLQEMPQNANVVVMDDSGNLHAVTAVDMRPDSLVLVG